MVMSSPDRRSGKVKQSKRHPKTSSNGSMGSPARDPSGMSKPRRRSKNAGIESPGRQQNLRIGSESSSRDLNVAPKPSRKKKSKGVGSGGGSIRSSETKGSTDSLTDSYFSYSPGRDYEIDSGEIYHKHVYDKYDEENNCEEISRGIRTL